MRVLGMLNLSAIGVSCFLNSIAGFSGVFPDNTNVLAELSQPNRNLERNYGSRHPTYSFCAFPNPLHAFYNRQAFRIDRSDRITTSIRISV